MATRRLLFVALALHCALALGGGFLGGSVSPPVSNPLNLPQLTSSQVPGAISFLGSFAVPIGANTGFQYGLSSLFVSNNTMYAGASAYDPSNGNIYAQGGGVGDFTIPTLTGTRNYTGSCCTATVLNAPSVPGISSGSPTTPWNSTNGYRIGGTLVSGSNLLINGATYYDSPCETNSNNTGWLVSTSTATPGSAWGAVDTAAFQGKLSSLSWSGGTVTATAAYTVTPRYVNGTSFTMTISGASPAGYDGTYTVTMTSDTTFTYSLATNPGTETVPGSYSGGSIESSRHLFGPMNYVPSIWQPYFGKAYSLGGHALSVDGCYVPIGYSFQSFDPSAATGGAVVPVSTALDYFWEGAALNSVYPEQLSARSFSGPFPLTTTTGYYPATITGGNGTGPNGLTGATHVTLSLPSSTVTLSGVTLTTGQNQITVTSITGTLSNSGIDYSVTDTAGAVPGSTFLQPSFDWSPGTNLNSETTFNLTNPVNSPGATGDTLTLTPVGYQSGYYELIFSDGEKVVAHLQGTGPTSQGDTAESLAPYAKPASNDPTGFSTLNADGTLTTGASLTCSSCTTSIQVAPLGDNWAEEYDNPVAGGFFWPGTSTFAILMAHKDGISRGKGPLDVCVGSSSGSNSVPLSPDTSQYISLEFFLYKAQDLYNGSQGTQPVYQAQPYATVPFPGASNLFASNGCLITNSGYAGWATLDESHDILYIAPTTSAGSGIAGKQTVVYEYQITAP